MKLSRTQLYTLREIRNRGCYYAAPDNRTIEGLVRRRLIVQMPDVYRGVYNSRFEITNFGADILSCELAKRK